MSPEERAVIGAGLVAPEKTLQVQLSPEDFESNAGKAIWRVLRSRAAAGETVDVVTLISDLGESFRRLIAEIMGESFSAANLKAYVERVRKAAKRRALQALLEQAASDLSEPDRIIETTLQSLIDLNRREALRDTDFKNLMGEVIAQIDAAQSARERGEALGVPTGMGTLDRSLGGLHRSDLIIVAARPAMGKTAWMLSAAMNAARQGYRGGIVSAEMSAAQIAQRAVSGASDVSTYKLRTGALTQGEIQQIVSVTHDLAKLPIRIMDPDVCSPSDILTQAHVWASQGLDFLMVDFLQLLRSDRQAESRAREVGDMARNLKSIAKALNIPVIALCQLNRSLENRVDKRPVMADMRDSGEIEEAADEVLFLYRDCVYHDAPPDAAEIIIGKNRHGPIGVIPMRFLPERMCWIDPDLREEVCA